MSIPRHLESHEAMQANKVNREVFREWAAIIATQQFGHTSTPRDWIYTEGEYYIGWHNEHPRLYKYNDELTWGIEAMHQFERVTGFRALDELGVKLLLPYE